jgi:hypothetical protein
MSMSFNDDRVHDLSAQVPAAAAHTTQCCDENRVTWSSVETQSLQQAVSQSQSAAAAFNLQRT